ncbi:MAG: Asp-tRNA(Asn)/Glu-tRNA(Gln) amidotransferase subunit GatA [Dongiaceae bacterium]
MTKAALKTEATRLTDLTIAEAVNGLKQKQFSAVELTEAHIKATEKARDLNAFITESFDAARAAAKQSDERISQGKVRALEGVPLAIKDIFCTKNIRSTASSKILENFIPPYESTVTQKLLNAGAVFIGKTSLDEFAMGSSNQTSAYGAVKSPWKKRGDDRPLVPGGSSGGSAAALAARCVMGATGTDTGGSIRQPASYSGIVGMKPTYGRCSRWGVIAFVSSLDHPGPMTRSVQDAAIMLREMSGYDPKESTSANVPVPDFEKALTGDIRGLKVGIPKEYRIDGMSAEIDKMWQQGMSWLKAAGAEIVDVSLPHTKYAMPVYYILAPAETSSNLERYDGVRFGLRVEGKTPDEMYENTRAAGFGPEVTRRILIGTYVLSAGYFDAYYVKAQKIRRLITNDYIEAFKKVDVLLTPTSPGTAFAIGDKMDDPIKMFLEDVFTSPADLAGIPAISVPAGLASDGLPLGLQIIGKHFDEATTLKVAHVIETAANFTAKPQFVAGDLA